MRDERKNETEPRGPGRWSSVPREKSQDGYPVDTPWIPPELHPGEVHEPRDLPRVGHTGGIPPVYRQYPASIPPTDPGHTANTPRTHPPESSGDGVSPLARALRAWLERSPADHPDRQPAEARRGPASVLANTVWALSPPGSGKPTAQDVREALEELEQRGWEAA